MNRPPATYEVSLREYFEQSIKLRFEALDSAVKLASAIENERQTERAAEISRRLEILNHAHQQAVEVQQTYVPRELHDAAIDKLKGRLESLEKTAAIAAALLVAAQVLFSWWSKHP